MRVLEDTGQVESAGLGESIEFDIEMSSTIFDMVSKGIYDDPPLAIVRELTCNGADSHIMAGKADVPVEISLPNALDPELSFRDYGVGLSPQRLKEIFRKVGSSDKRDNDQLTGEKGLGSKSPLAYRDSFGMVCYDGTVARHYTIAKCPGRPPRVHPMAEVPCNEPAGVKVVIPVKDCDFSTFFQNTRRVVSDFAHPFSNGCVKPRVLGGDMSELKDSWHDVKMVTPHVGYRKMEGNPYSMTTNFRHRATFYCANVGYYQVDLNRVIGNDVKRFVNDYPLAALSELVFFVPLASPTDGGGLLSPTAGRDTIQHHPRTVAWIDSQLKLFTEQMKAHVIQQVSAPATWVERCDAYRLWVRLGARVDGNFGEFLQVVADQHSPKLLSCDFSALLAYVVDFKHFQVKHVGLRQGNTSVSHGVALDDALVHGFLLVDEPQYWRRRADDAGVDMDYALLGAGIGGSAADFDQLEARLKEHGIKSVRVSSLPVWKPVRIPRAAKSKVVVTKGLRYFRYQHHDQVTQRWVDPDEPQVGASHLLVSLYGYDFRFLGKLRSQVPRPVLQMLSCDECPYTKLRGVRETETDVSRPLPDGFRWFQDFIVEELAFVQPLIARHEFMEQLKGSFNSHGLRRLLSPDLFPTFPDPKVAEVISRARQLDSNDQRKLTSYANIVYDVGQALGLKIPDRPDYTKQFDAVSEVLAECFPLVTYTSAHIQDKKEFAAAMLDYTKSRKKTYGRPKLKLSMLPKLPPAKTRPGLLYT